MPPTKEQIAHHETQLLTAMQEGDLDTLDALLHNDLRFIIPTGATVTKDMDLDNFRSGNLKIDHLQATNQSIQLIEDIAIVEVEIELQGSFMGQAITGQFKYLRTWKKFGEDNWKVISGAGVQLL